MLTAQHELHSPNGIRHRPSLRPRLSSCTVGPFLCAAIFFPLMAATMFFAVSCPCCIAAYAATVGSSSRGYKTSAAQRNSLAGKQCDANAQQHRVPRTVRGVLRGGAVPDRKVALGSSNLQELVHDDPAGVVELRRVVEARVGLQPDGLEDVVRLD